MATIALDFSIKSGPLAYRGLTMGLCPGDYAGKVSAPRSVFIQEAAFGPLEEAIRMHSLQYARQYAHWGVSVVSRQEWALIIDDWKAERARLQSGGELQKQAIWWLTIGSNPEQPVANLPENTRRLIVLIEELSAWLQATLETYDQICVLGT